MTRGQPALRVEESALAAHADDGADGVEEVAQHDREGQAAPTASSASLRGEGEVEPPEGGEVRDLDDGRGDLRRARRREALPAREGAVEHDREGRRQHDAEEERPAHPAGHQPRGQDEADQRRPRWAAR